MFHDKIIQAWKDPFYRLNLSKEEQEALPENPAGAIELTDEELESVAQPFAESVGKWVMEPAPKSVVATVI
jgi:mersacidin/lichenicidin family type 2 lantibiotic